MAGDDSGVPLPATSPSARPALADTPQHSRGLGERASAKSGARVGTFGELARRITDVTSRVLITFLILAAGLSFGIQVLRWWRESSATAPPPGIDPGSVERTYGGGPRVPTRFNLMTARGGLSAVSLSGNEREAEKQAEELCLQMARATTIPTSPPGREELELLERLKTARPVRSDGGDLHLFRCPGDFSLWAIVRQSSEEAVGGGKSNIAPSASRAGPGPGGALVAPEKSEATAIPRVVGWGVLMPAGGERWTLYFATVYGAGLGWAPAIGEMPQKGGMRRSVIEAPPGAKWTFQLSLSPGNWVGVFEETSPGSAATWPLFLDRNLAREGWHPLGEWTQRDDTTGRRYRRVSGKEQEEFMIVKFGRTQPAPGRGVVIYFRQEKAGEFLDGADGR